MKLYSLIYIGGDQPATPEEGKAHFAKYQAWLGSLGDAAVEPMVPFKNTQTLEPDGSVTPGSKSGISGHTIIRAASIEEAVTIAQGCPFLEINGTLEIAELSGKG